MKQPQENSPQSFAGIIGQEKAKKLLRRAVAQDRLAHAFLFKGPMGVGKKTLARTFAAALNCHNPKDHEPCGQCPSCRKFTAGSHPDFIVIEPEGAAIKINQVRELKKTLAFPPFEAKIRVALVCEIHTMRREAANSLLKTLEEPPAQTMLILTGDEAGGILPTILSRCQTVPFFPLPQPEVAKILAREAGITTENAATLAAMAEGSLGRARLLLAKDLLGLRREIIEHLLRLEPDTPTAIQALGELAETAARLKEDLGELLDLLTTWHHDLLLFAHGAPGSIINYDLSPTFPAACRRWSKGQLADKLHLLDTARKQLARNCNPTAVCEVLFFGLL
ncbi:MAG: DNA polymerase III subunit delta' [Deltaproteobacteria bacterium RIFOXYD12_FULL_56_24]|nr:MAG: DNA polymerase III subunit delta' [Deltaproteobacteria bacterium RIFOXYD12_FULL_56_24]